MQLTWGPSIIDAVFRGGAKHSNHGDTVAQMIRHVVQRIRRHYDAEAVIVLTQDSAFFDQALLSVYEEVDIGSIVGGKAYTYLRAAVDAQPASAWVIYQQGAQQRLGVKLGERRGTWSRFRRVVSCQADSEATGQLLLDCARPETILYTNLGVSLPTVASARETGTGASRPERLWRGSSCRSSGLPPMPPGTL